MYICTFVNIIMYHHISYIMYICTFVNTIIPSYHHTFPSSSQLHLFIITQISRLTRQQDLWASFLQLWYGSSGLGFAGSSFPQIRLKLVQKSLQIPQTYIRHTVLKKKPLNGGSTLAKQIICQWFAMVNKVQGTRYKVQGTVYDRVKVAHAPPST